MKKMKFDNPYWCWETKIQMLERWILVHSYLYYELNENAVSDAEYDSNARQLKSMIERNQGAAKRSKYYKVFKDFEGSGFNLFTKLEKCDKIRIREDAERILKNMSLEK